MTRRPGSRLPAAERTAAELGALVPWVTPRQLEYWVARGWILAAGPPAQGRPRSFTGPELKVLRTMARLVRAGIPAQLAAQAARRAVTVADGTGTAAVALYGGDLLLIIRDI